MTAELETTVYTLPEVAERLRCSPNYIYTLHNREGLPFVRMGKRTVVRASDLAVWLAEHVDSGHTDTSRQSKS